MVPILEWALQKGPTPAKKIWRQNPEQAHAWTTTENEKNNIVCVCFFFSQQFISISKAVDLFSYSFSLIGTYQEKMVANKFISNKQADVFCVFITFSHEVTIGVRLEFKAWCYTHIPIRTMAVQMSMWYHNATRVYWELWWWKSIWCCNITNVYLILQY